MARQELKHKPLTEAIFELKWEIPPQNPQRLEGDPFYRILFARFSEKIQAAYPAYEPLAAAQIPDGMIAHNAQHRFRTSRAGWPLVQIGHGVMTVNDTDSYTWDDFRDRAMNALQHLYASHPAPDQLKIKELTLRYLNAIEMEYGNEDVFEFLHSKLKTKIRFLDSLFAGGSVDSAPKHLALEAAFPSNDPDGTMFIKLGTGQRHGNPAVLLDTRVLTAGGDLPQMPEGFTTWLNRAHDRTDDWFFKLIEGELEEQFS